MPVSTDTRPSCTHCQEGGQSESESERLVWRIQLDQDLVDTLVGIYPEWFNVRPQAGPMAAESGPPGAPPPPPLSPPKAEVDDSPLQKSMDKNKESLKVKLMLRRPINQLVAQGIMPPLKTPPAFHEQRQKLERAKMGDLLKAKIQQRPDRQELVRQHILEVDVGHVDPSLAERQRMLKKCRLADALNDQLSHRPGPLELIKKNILHTDEPIERAVKEGHIEFKATCEGQKTKPQPPDHYMTLDDDSLSSEATSPLDLLSSPPHDSQGLLPDTHDLLQDTHDLLTDASGLLHTELLTQCRSTLPETRDLLHDALSGSRDVLETAAAQAGIVTVVVTPGTLLATTAPSPSLSLTSSLSPLSSISSPPSSTTRSTPQSFSAPGKDKNRKKSKTKTQPKTRTIKFHEYKGPPNAHKTSPLSASPVETSYELLLQQQQLFLQWQLEWQHKYPQIILPASQKPPDPTPSLITVTTAPPAPPPPPTTQPPPPPPPPVPDTRPLRNLEDMKVSDLKAELKKRNLPVSGAKPQLIERLKPFSESAANCTNTIIPTSDDSLLSVCQVSPPPQALSIHSGGSICDPDSPPAPPQAPTPTPAQSPGSPASSVAMETELSEEIIREQRRRIDQLQRQLLRSQMQLQQQQQQQTTFQPQQSLNAKASLAAFLQQQQLNQLLLQQSQQQQQLLGIANNNLINSNNNNNKLQQQQQQQQQQQTRTNGDVSPQHQQHALVLNQINLKGNQNLRTSSLPNFLGTFVQTAPSVMNEPVKTEAHLSTEMMEDKPIPSPSSLPPLPPPLYHDATKLLRVKQEVDDDVKGVKSQIVDDVLEILIKNGELPPSAAQDPYPSNLDLRELGLDMESLDSNGVETMDLGDNLPPEELMDIDTVWLDSLMEPPLTNGAPSTSHDPLLPQDPFDFFNIDENDFKMAADFGWDRVDFAT